MRIRSMFASSAAIAVLAIASSAFAAPAINLAAVNHQSANVTTGTTEQLAGTIDINVGHVADSNIDMSATNLVDASLDKVNVNQNAWGANVALVNDQSLNLSLNDVGQGALTIVGTGNVDRSNLTGSALNADAIATKATVIVQN